MLPVHYLRPVKATPVLIAKVVYHGWSNVPQDAQAFKLQRITS
jgi:hypothetical protein